MIYQYSEYEIRQKIRAEYDRVYSEACEIYPAMRNARKPSLAFDVKGRTAGYASYSRWEVSFNLNISRQNWAMCVDTISHEVAHMVAFYVFNARGHGAEWRKVHLALGGNGKRCYDAAENNITVKAARRTKQHEYKLDSGYVLWINTPSHNKIQKGYARRLRSTGEGIEARHCTFVSRYK